MSELSRSLQPRHLTARGRIAQRPPRDRDAEGGALMRPGTLSSLSLGSGL